MQQRPDAIISYSDEEDDDDCNVLEDTIVKENTQV
eukprot:CAMPEP_0176347808 /NCGR_PEP_ID=MMETSP0126-20121128/7367_1 /TAXON_ID=141414 ORGANISM="Strombidinopsis acuminatum, Strain SPMC142" /NCGR_SAMPLE_ID=MMETSP0126 /ASSEMBLY_ACC=CAM_ASM_000229 /LENGTH=34 /DNA_ID= /DNA_START= /DNA_END= /DNA_ORIENTATION=